MNICSVDVSSACMLIGVGAEVDGFCDFWFYGGDFGGDALYTDQGLKGDGVECSWSAGCGRNWSFYGYFDSYI